MGDDRENRSEAGSPEDHWPRSLVHLASTIDDDRSSDVTIALISDATRQGVAGAIRLTTALVPLAIVDEVTRHTGGMGWHVESRGPRPCVAADALYETSFWIYGRVGTSERFESVVCSWDVHNRQVVVPDNALLMTYGLVPRLVDAHQMAWDDPHGPVHDVLRVRSLANFDDDAATEPLAEIRIRREYLEDYCALKGCAAVSTFFEERYSNDDPLFDQMLGRVEGIELHLPGRLLALKRFRDDYHEGRSQLSQVWGCRLLLRPKERPISNRKELSFQWPGFAGPMTCALAMHERPSSLVYVRDEVLCRYENRPEFEIHPENGAVGYGGWWSVSYSHRMGRDHIALEIKKLYEGCPAQVVEHWHSFAVAKDVVDRDVGRHGYRSIATRAKELVEAYMAVTRALTNLAGRLPTSFTQAEIGTLTDEDLEYRGWWKPDVVRPLTHVARADATKEDFSNRCLSLFKLFEGLKPVALRNLVIGLGVTRDPIKEFRSMKLLGTICQLAELCREHGRHFPKEMIEVVEHWDLEARLAYLKTPYALNQLRTQTAHVGGIDKAPKFAEAAGAFDIRASAQAGGWGSAIDKLYDGLTRDLRSIAQVIEPDPEPNNLH